MLRCLFDTIANFLRLLLLINDAQLLGEIFDALGDDLKDELRHNRTDDRPQRPQRQSRQKPHKGARLRRDLPYDAHRAARKRAKRSSYAAERTANTARRRAQSTADTADEVTDTAEKPHFLCSSLMTTPSFSS